MSRSPIREILGVENPANPFEVLGLPVGHVTESDIIDALGERMHDVAQHPHSETPEGNEVRLALHAAAAQLLDGRIRAALIERAGVVAVQQKHLPRNSAAARSPAAALGPQALMVIAGAGGWNPRAMRRLAMLAHAEGIASSEIPDVVRSVAGDASPRAHQNSQQELQERQGKVPRHVAPEQRSDAVQMGLTIGSVAVAIGILAVTWGVLSDRVDGVPASSQMSMAPVDGKAPALEEPTAARADSQDESSAVAPSTAELDAPDWASALVGMRDAKQAGDAETVRRVLDGIATTWPDRSSQDIRRIATAFVDVVYLLSPEEGTDLVTSMADRIREGDVSAASLYAGLLTRLSIERSLATSVDNATVAAMVATIGSGQRIGEDVFVQGVARGLGLRAAAWPSAPPPAEQLKQWLRCLDAISRIDPRADASLTRDTLESILRSGRDPLADAPLLRATEALAGRLDPIGDAEDAGVILRVLTDPDVETPAASVLVNAIARSSGADGNSGAVRLSPAGSDVERADVRARLAEAWLGQADSAEDIAEIRAAILKQIEHTPAGDAEEWIADAVVSARLSNACRLVFWGTSEQAAVIVGSLFADLDQQSASRTRSTSGGADTSDAWAVRYLEAKRNIPVRHSLLGELVQRRSVLSTIAAELVVSEAVSGSPARVRREAQNVVMLAADQPAVINATLELLPVAPRVRSVQDLVEQIAARSLPDIDDPQWPFEARRAVVDRLLEAESVQGEAQAIDELAQLLSEEYRGMLAMQISILNPVDDTLEAIVEQRFEEIRRIDLAGNAAVETEAIGRMLLGRLALAEGGATRSVAFQVTGVELLAQIIGLESPHLRGQTERVVSDLASASLTAGSVFEQMAMVERAGLRLWALRIGVEP